MEKLKERITENGIDYILAGDYYIPDLKLPEENRPIGRYGRLHREYLKQEHPAQPIAKQNVPDARMGSPKGFPCPYFTTKGGEFTYQSSFFIKKSILRKERGKKYEFLHNSSYRIKDSRYSNRRRRGSMGRYQSA